MRQIAPIFMVLILLFCSKLSKAQTLITTLPAQEAVAYTPVKYQSHKHNYEPTTPHYLSDAVLWVK